MVFVLINLLQFLFFFFLKKNFKTIIDQIKYYAIRSYLNDDFMQCLSTKLDGSVSN